MLLLKLVCGVDITHLRIITLLLLDHLAIIIEGKHLRSFAYLNWCAFIFFKHNWNLHKVQLKINFLLIGTAKVVVLSLFRNCVLLKILAYQKFNSINCSLILILCCKLTFFLFCYALLSFKVQTIYFVWNRGKFT